MSEIVYISGHLCEARNKDGFYGKRVFEELSLIPEIQLKNLDTKNVWCRDYMPVKTASGKYVQFTYHPRYMVGDKYKDNFPDTAIFLKDFNLEWVTPKKQIILDGGAIEIHGKKGIVSDRVFRDNLNRNEAEIYNDLKTLLELDQLIVIPQYPYDFTGHVDGLVRFIDDNRVVVNDLKKELEEAQKDKNRYRKQLIENWIYAFKSSLLNAGLQKVELPTSIPEESPPSSGEGIYTNFLLLEDLIVMPVYGKKEDKIAADRLSNLYSKIVKTVNAKALSQMGGMINCVTWTK